MDRNHKTPINVPFMSAGPEPRLQCQPGGNPWLWALWIFDTSTYPPVVQPGNGKSQILVWQLRATCSTFPRPCSRLFTAAHVAKMHNHPRCSHDSLAKQL